MTDEWQDNPFYQVNTYLEWVKPESVPVVDADLQFIASSTGVPALISDQTQFALIGGPETLGAVVGGADLVAIVQLSGAQPYLMEVTKSIQTLDDLRGKKVAVSTLGSSSDTATRLS